MARRLIAYLLLICYLPACTTWHVERGIRPERVIATQRPQTVRVTRTDSSRLILVQPSLVALDSVSGIHHSRRTSLPLWDIAQVETRKVDDGATIAVVALVSIVGVVVAAAAIKGVFEKALGKMGSCWMGCS